MINEILWVVGKIVFWLVLIFSLLVVMIWAERKGAGYIQDRSGPNRASLGGVLRLGGLVHPVADVLKLIFKEDLVPANVNRFFFHLAPFMMMCVALTTFAVIPFGDKIYFADGTFQLLQVANLNVGVLFILAIASLSVLGTVLAGWASNNKYAFLGGLRATAQMISYEINMGLAIISILLVYNSVRLGDIVAGQGGLLWGWLPMWGIVLQPLGFILFLTALFAEVNRTPFDLPEGESELVAGYHLEYSGLQFALFYMAEYASMIVGAAFVSTLYIGGWQIPWASTEWLWQNAGVLMTGLFAFGVLFNLFLAWLMWRHYLRQKGTLGDKRELEGAILAVVFLLGAVGMLGYLLISQPWAMELEQARHWTTALQMGSFILKTMFFSWLFIWVRWTLPRFRYDQLMKLGWKYMLPLGLLNFVVTAAIVLLIGS